MLNTSHSHSKHVYHLNMLQSGGINVFKKWLIPKHSFYRWLFLVYRLHEWANVHPKPKTIDGLCSFTHSNLQPLTKHDYFLHAVFFFLFFTFFNLIKLYQEFLQRTIRFRPISNSKIPHIWCIVGLKRGKINALWDTFYHLFNPIMHHIYPTMYQICDIHYCNTELVITNQH